MCDSIRLYVNIVHKRQKTNADRLGNYEKCQRERIE